MIDRIAHAVLHAIAPAVHDTIRQELGKLLGTDKPVASAAPSAPAKKAAARKSPGRPKKHTAKEDAGAIPEAHSQAGQIIALLQKGTRSGTELAEGTGLTTRQVHSNLQSLRKRHLVVTKGRGQYALANGVSP